MSEELKTYDLPVDHGDFTATVELFYLKSEADKVIAHQKYKRCLAMAKWCAAECVVNQDTYRRYLTHKSKFRIGHLRKWHKRWLELAEKFKEAK